MGKACASALVLWIASLALTAAVAAQVAPQPVPPKVLSGADIGFEVTAIDPVDGAAVGRLVINVNGKWVPAYIRGGRMPRLTP